MTACRAALGPLLLALAVASAPAAAEVDEKDLERIGDLDCNPGDRVNVIIKSKTDLHCLFEHRDGPREVYPGTTELSGLDGSILRRAPMPVYTVKGQLPRFEPSALTGEYSGWSVAVAAIMGVKSKLVLRGGDGGDIVLVVPLRATRGIGIEGGRVKLTLERSEELGEGRDGGDEGDQELEDAEGER